MLQTFFMIITIKNTNFKPSKMEHGILFRLYILSGHVFFVTVIIDINIHLVTDTRFLLQDKHIITGKIGGILYSNCYLNYHDALEEI